MALVNLEFTVFAIIDGNNALLAGFANEKDAKNYASKKSSELQGLVVVRKSGINLIGYVRGATKRNV